MEYAFEGAIWFWKGPAPWYFVPIPAAESAEIRALAGLVTYGWGVIPVTVTLGTTTWSTSLIPKDGAYLVPIKASVRAAERLAEGDTVALQLTLGR